jgi:hypothetical protein
MEESRNPVGISVSDYYSLARHLAVTDCEVFYKFCISNAINGTDKPEKDEGVECEDGHYKQRR